jgi:sigma-E factor negative regulatory protein RseC
MIETPARVVAVEPGYAWVESGRRSSCSHCAGGDSCGVSSLGKLFAVRTQRMRLPDPLGLRTGEDVVIGLSEQRLVVAAAVAYMLPLFTMITAALAGAHLGQGQLAPALSSLAGLAGGLWLVKHRSGRRRVMARYRPVITGRPPLGEHTIEFKTRNTGVEHE